MIVYEMMSLTHKEIGTAEKMKRIDLIKKKEYTSKLCVIFYYNYYWHDFITIGVLFVWKSF